MNKGIDMTSLSSLWTSGRHVVAGLVATAVLASCSESLAPEAELEIAAARWAERGGPDYEFVLDRTCECLVVGPVRLTVQDGDVHGAEALEGSSAPGTHPDPEQFPTIDELFAQLRAAAAAGPVRFEVAFDHTLGHPVSVDVDISEQIADEELLFEVRDLVLHERLEVRARPTGCGRGATLDHIEIENQEGDLVADSEHGLGGEVGAGIAIGEDASRSCRSTCGT